MGTTIWSHLESGILTGKYINETPPDRRAKLTKSKEIAEKKCGCGLTTLAITQFIANPDINIYLLGASKPAQLDDTIKVLEVYRTIDKDTWI